MVELIQSMQDRGLTRGVLALKQRRTVTAGKTKNFVVPVLGVEDSLEAIASGAAQLGALPVAEAVAELPAASAPAIEAPAYATDDEVIEAELVDDDTVTKAKAKQAIHRAVGRDNDRALALWEREFPDDPDEVTRDALDAALATIQAPDPDGPGGGSPVPMAGEGEELAPAEQSATDGQPSDSPPDAEGGAVPSPPSAEGEIEASTRRRMFALVGELVPPMKNLSAAANEELSKTWLLALARAIDGADYTSRTELTDLAARKVILACESISSGEATYEDFVEGRRRITVRATGALVLQRPKGAAA